MFDNIQINQYKGGSKQSKDSRNDDENNIL